MKKSIKKNYIYNVAYQILILLTPLITSPYIARTLGPDGIGTASYIGSVSSYFMLVASMGIATFAQREVSYYQEDRTMRTQVFWEVKLLQLTTCGVCFAAYFVFCLFQENRILYLISGIGLLNMVLDVSWLYQGMEEFGALVFRNVVFKAIHIIYIFTFVHSKEDLPLYMLESVFGSLSAMAMWPKLPSMIGRPDFKKLRPFRHFKTVFLLFVPTIAIQIYTVLDKTMIGVITHDTYENGYYEQAIRISKMLLTLVTSLGTVMVPRIGKLYAEKNTESIRNYMYRSYRFVWFLGIPICFGLIMTAGNFIPWFLGDGYEKVISLTGILSLLILDIGISNVTGLQYLIPTRRENTFTFTVTVGAVVNFFSNMALIYSFQATGAAVASVVAETTIAVVQLIIVRKELSPWRVLKEGKHYFIAGLIMVAALIPLTKALSPSFFHTFVIVAVGAAVYFAVLLLMRDEFFLSNVERAVNLVKRRGGS